jgi:hypothetical protein
MEIQIFHHSKIYTNALANSTLIILFSEMLKKNLIFSSKSYIYIYIVKDNSEHLGIFYWLK